ncbi:MAG: ABC transporter ATP-binding protein [Phycisphaeraceae bacterium]|nr:ABC transporter ATP-binding protein [Phycisphaeraceae bacterium]
MTTGAWRPALGLRAQSVSRRFGEVEALRQVTMEVAPGEFVVVVGASGCGKTTLLRIIGGLERCDAGSIDFFDREEGAAAIATAPSEARRFDLGFAFQEPRLLPWRCARDNVALPLELAGVPREERRRRAVEALELVRLGARTRALPAELSGGMRMRVALARALVTKPRLLLLDEPFSALDEVTRLELDEELLRLRQESGATVLMVTHSISEALSLADRIVVLASSPGRVREELTVNLGAPGVARRGTPDFGPLTARIFEMLGERGSSSSRDAKSASASPRGGA